MSQIPYIRPQRLPVQKQPSFWDKFGGSILSGLGTVVGGVLGGPAGAAAGGLGGGLLGGATASDNAPQPAPQIPNAQFQQPQAPPEPALSPAEVEARRRLAEQALLAQLTQNRYGMA